WSSPPPSSASGSCSWCSRCSWSPGRCAVSPTGRTGSRCAGAPVGRSR
ncbi:MAG: hypothetical protein AVDCRST_MAG66-2697, partial [uncultured Pseudonocardia sp.]